MVLEPNVSFEWAIAHSGQFLVLGDGVHPVVDDFNPVKSDTQMMSLTIDHHMVPFACFFGHVHLGSDSSYDAAVVIEPQFYHQAYRWSLVSGIRSLFARDLWDPQS